jgi:predicted homoserine dehydrogenase-like protein
LNLHALLAARVAADKPVRVGLIGAGKFGSMFLAQVPSIGGLDVATICDLDPERAKIACRNVGWDSARIARTRYIDNGRAACSDERLDVVIEATGDPAAGIAHALTAIEARKPIVMVNVEADALAGALLARKARAAKVIYSMAYGDQPALIAEMVDWARAAGFTVAAAGKGTKYLPAYHAVTPDLVWEHYGLTAAEAKVAGMNSQMFNSFLDGTKSAIEMAAVANACSLDVPDDGLGFPPCGADDLAHVLRPRQIGGVLAGDGMVEVISSLKRDGAPVERDLRWGVYVVLKANNDYAAACFKQYGLPTDATGRYAAMYKPFHLIGLELSISVLSVALRGEPTGSCREWRGDAVAVAKRALKAGETLDGEGGYTVYAKLIPAARSLQLGALPIGLASRVKLTRDVAAGAFVTQADVALDEAAPAVRIRREMEREARQMRPGNDEAYPAGSANSARRPPIGAAPKVSAPL